MQRYSHVVASLNVASGTISIWVDGNLAADQRTFIRPPSVWRSGAGLVTVGSQATPTTIVQQFVGYIDEVSLYARVLTEDEIRAGVGRHAGMFTSIRNTGSEMIVEAAGQHERPFALEVSENLREWSPLASQTCVYGGLRFSLPGPNAKRAQFYRLRSVNPP